MSNLKYLNKLALPLYCTSVQEVKEMAEKMYEDEEIDWEKVIVQSEKILIVLPFFGGDSFSSYEKNAAEAIDNFTFTYEIERKDGITLMDVIEVFTKHNAKMKEYWNDYGCGGHIFAEKWEIKQDFLDIPILHIVFWGS